MPHVEKNVNSKSRYDPFVEPYLKKLKPDFNSLCTGKDAAIHQPSETKTPLHTWDFIPLQVSDDEDDDEDGQFDTKECENEGAAVIEVLPSNTRESYPNSADLSLGTGISSNHSSRVSSNTIDYNKTHQQSIERYSFESNKNKSHTVSDGKFSQTSNAFIGPVFQPSLKEEYIFEGLANKDRNHKNVDAPCYKINTVVLGKANRSSGKNGMDYELRQFYKELEQLASATDDQPDKGIEQKLEVIQTPVFSISKSDKVPVVETSVHPYNKEHFHIEQAGCREHNMSNRYSFVNHTIPPPMFPSQLPHSFIIPYGPPPPLRYNYPLIYPRQEFLPFMPHPQNLQPSNGFIAYQQPNNQHRWNSPPVRENSSYNDQGFSNRMRFPEDVGRNRAQEVKNVQIRDHNPPHFNAAYLTPGVGIVHEHYADKSVATTTAVNRKLVLLRGLPGSGKTTLAQNLLDLCPRGIVFSTDDYFYQKEGYTYDVKLLGDAHVWNQNRARRAMDDGKTPVIIDNTNTQSWEMKPYVHMATERGYIVEFLEPDTWWKLDPLELEKRNKHGVPREKISQMLDRYESDMTVSVVMNSVDPPHRSAKKPPSQSRQRWGGSVHLSDSSTTYHNQ